MTGPATSKWGSLRAKAGHPAPFKLTYVEVGNEDFFDRSGSYDQRFVQFSTAIKARYPQLKVISTVGFEQPEGGASTASSRTCSTSTTTGPSTCS